jgi:LysR family transcriptional regulator, glycine cleavage system transcriptional activator
MNFIHSDAMNGLPPLDALIAFDATLRHRSMTQAATELGMTQSAVSHRLRRLEAFIGVPLLLRSSTGVTATPAGTALAEGLIDLIGDLAGLRARCRAAIAPAGLKVGVGAALADYWLVRRLPRFMADSPDIAIELVMVESAAQARSLDFDIHVLWLPSTSARATSTQRLLFQEHVFPVCHPRLLPDGRPLADATALASMPILHKGPAGGSGAEWSWPVWFQRLGIGVAPPNGLRFEMIGTAIAAALQGAGVVLARSLLVRDALAEGRLARVLPEAWDVPSSKTHLVRWPAALVGDARVGKFVAWLAEEASATGVA